MKRPMRYLTHKPALSISSAFNYLFNILCLQGQTLDFVIFPAALSLPLLQILTSSAIDMNKSSQISPRFFDGFRLRRCSVLHTVPW